MPHKFWDSDRFQSDTAIVRILNRTVFGGTVFFSEEFSVKATVLATESRMQKVAKCLLF